LLAPVRQLNNAEKKPVNPPYLIPADPEMTIYEYLYIRSAPRFHDDGLLRLADDSVFGGDDYCGKKGGGMISFKTQGSTALLPV
jgi:hypothetical protein